MNWSYVSGFFDGEGGVSVFGRVGAFALALKVTICQKSLDVLQKIKSFLILFGIRSAIYCYKNGLHVLEVGRIYDLSRFFHLIKPVVKNRQVQTALDYLEGRISGNSLLQIFDQEYAKHKRKNSPLRSLGPRFPMTRLEAREAAANISLKARIKGNRTAYLNRLEKRILALPAVFHVRDIESTVGVSKPRAQVIGNLFVREGFAKFHYERVAHRRGHATKVFQRL